MNVPTRLLKNLLNSVSDGVYLVDRDRRIVFWNKGAEEITGYKKGEVLGVRCADNILVHVDDRGRNLCLNSCPAAACLETGQDREANVFLHHKDGQRVPVRVLLRPVKDSSGRVVGAAEVFADRTPAQTWNRNPDELQRIIFQDELSGLGNRRFLEANIKRCLIEARSYEWAFGLLFVDLDRFKAINDTFGHDAGDRVLRMTARTLANSLRSYDIVCRYGGDEFVAILVGMSPKKLAYVSEKVRRLIRRSVLVLEDQTVHVSVSIGGTLFRPEDTPAGLMKRADRLLYQSKERGRDRVMIG